jgi:hypothetical protein
MSRPFNGSGNAVGRQDHPPMPAFRLKGGSAPIFPRALFERAHLATGSAIMKTHYQIGSSFRTAMRKKFSGSMITVVLRPGFETPG